MMHSVAEAAGRWGSRGAAVFPLNGSDERSGGPSAAAGGRARPSGQAEEDDPGSLFGGGTQG